MNKEKTQAGGTPEHWRREYMSRINRVTNYIENHLDKALTLDHLAKVANFSPFHFHRIFGAMIGETLNHFIVRLRVEKAAMLLVTDSRKTVTEIALDCGFSSSATFARAFKKHFAMSATEWRRDHHSWRKNRKQNRKNCKADRKHGEAAGESSEYVGDSKSLQPRRDDMPGQKKLDVEVLDLPELNVAYVRHVGPYAGMPDVFERIFGKLMKWAGPRGIVGGPDTRILSVYHDDPEVTDEEKLRVDACITVPEDTKVEGEIGLMKVPGGKFAVAHFELAPNEYAAAWTALMGVWMPESGYQPDDRLCYEWYRNDPEEHPEGKCITDICVPVKPL